MSQFQREGVIFTITPTSKSYSCEAGVMSVLRAPTDPYFYASLTLQNIIIGSSYLILQESNPSNIIASGIASATSLIISSIAAYENPMLVEIRLRNSSGTPRYLPYTTYGYIISAGTTVYCAQVEDSIAN